jgi:hypothetical protein
MLYLFFFDNNLIDFYNLFILNGLINNFLFNIINFNIFYYSLLYYNYILIVIMIYTTINNKYLLVDFKYFIIYIYKSICLFIKNIGSSFYENFNYIFMGYFKHIFLNLLIRLIEINKEEERYKYRKINIS